MRQGLTICHFGDWDGKYHMLPEADIYICTGNILPNFRVKVGKEAEGYTRLLPHRETALQGKFLRQVNLRRLFPNKDAPVVVCRGSHDYISLYKLFAGGPCYEVGNNPEVFDIYGARIAGIRGAPVGGTTMNDACTPEKMERRVLTLPKMIDILVSHWPPVGMLDKPDVHRQSIGSTALARYLESQFVDDKGNRKPPNLKLHCFGQVKDRYGLRSNGKVHSIQFSNSAGGFRVLRWSGRRFIPVHILRRPDAIKINKVLRSGS